MNPRSTAREADAPQRNLTTADLAAAAENQPQADAGRPLPSQAPMPRSGANAPKDDELAPLFSNDLANEFRSRWEAVQSSFVDDPREAVRQGDELVAQVMKSLAESFATERKRLESQLRDRDAASTESLRVAFRRYHSFFERLLAI